MITKSNKMNTILTQWSPLLVRLLVVLFCITVTSTASALDLGSIADNVTGTFGKLAKLITASAYIAGLGFSIGSIMKFKQHKDNPTQIPIGTPIALLFIAAALLFLPTLLGVTQQTIFGGDATVAGPSGTIFRGGN